MYYIGIDGGGTTSDYLLMNDEGQVLAKVQDGPTNPNSHGKEAVKNHLRSGLSRLLEGIQAGPDDLIITLASAGVDLEEDKQPFYRMLEDLGYKRTYVVNDALAALSAGSQGQDGIIVVAGTGSIVMGQNQDLVKRAGGWGHILGDEGSAYRIAIQGLQRVIEYADGYGQATGLCEALLEATNSHKVEDFLPYIYQKSFKKDKIAELAVLVDQLSQAGDPVARAILEDQAKLLARQVVALYNRLFGGQGPIPLVCSGSVLTKSNYFKRCFTAALKDVPLNLVDLEVDPALGAAYLSKKKVANEKNIC